MVKFVMLIGDKEIDMTNDIKTAKEDQDITKALVKALKTGTQEEIKKTS